MEHLELNSALNGLDQLEDNFGVKPLFKLPLEHQVKFLDALKNIKDCERGKTRGRGFSNASRLNPERSPRVFTFLEEEFFKLSEGFNVQLNHEVRLKCKDRFNCQHIFKLDFLEPLKRVNIEISPNWHKLYLPVQRRDALRKQLLRRHRIKSLTVPVINKGIHGHIDYARAKRILRYIESLPISVQSLDHYLGTPKVEPR
jgi:hypothetical protein